MKIFKEEQKFNQWWLYLVCVSVGLMCIFQFFPKNLTELNWRAILGPTLGLAIGLGIFFIKMHIKIDHSGITVWFSPFWFTKKQFNLNQLSQIYIRHYYALTEYGGWGIRGLGKPAAYNVKGNKGIQLETREGYRFLIGAQQPGKADRVIQRYYF